MPKHVNKYFIKTWMAKKQNKKKNKTPRETMTETQIDTRHCLLQKRQTSMKNKWI
jgi:hypothetical protein